MAEISLWGLATIIGPLILLALFGWVIVRNRSSKVSDEVTERATEANYQAEDRATKNQEL